jgi:endonuclease III
MSQIQLITAVLRRLDTHFGERAWHQSNEGLDELVQTILSQSTTDANSGRAFANLQQRYFDWDDVRNAPFDELVDVIRVAGLARNKAKHIQKLLEHLFRTTGRYSIDHLTQMPTDDAFKWLINIPGVGPKTAACTLMFAYGMPFMPVDTHVGRVSARLSIVDTTNAEKAHHILHHAIPDHEKYAYHVHLIHLGRQICHARTPHCARCPLSDLCPKIGIER